MRRSDQCNDAKARRQAAKHLFLCILLSLCLWGEVLAATDSKNPTSDEAVSGTWDGTAGSRYTVVDDYPDASGVDYLTHGTTAGNLTFGFSAFSIPAGSTVSQVAVLYYDQKSAAQSCTIGGRLKVGGSYFNATTHNPSNGTWVQRTDTWTTNPKSTAAWTVNDVNGVGTNALQAFGWVSTDASPTIRLSSSQAQVTYTPPGGRRAQTIVAELIGLRDDGNGVTAANGRNGTLDYGAGSGVDGDTYLSFTETLSFSADSNNAQPVPMVARLLRPLLSWWADFWDGALV